MGRILAQARRSNAQFTTGLCMGLSWYIGRLNLVFCNQLYLIVVVFIRCCCKNCIIQSMLPILVHVKPLLHFSSICDGLIQLSRLGNLWLVAQFANVLRMLKSYSQVFYSPYLFLHRSLSNALWTLLPIFLWFRVIIAYLSVLISLVSSVNSSLFSWVRESLVLSRYPNSLLTILCDFSEFLLMYSMTEMFISQLSFGRVYGRYLIPRLSSLQLTIHRLMVRLRDKTELQSRLYIVWYMRVVETGYMLFL